MTVSNFSDNMGTRGEAVVIRVMMKWWCVCESIIVVQILLCCEMR